MTHIAEEGKTVASQLIISACVEVGSAQWGFPGNTLSGLECLVKSWEISEFFRSDHRLVVQTMQGQCGSRRLRQMAT